LLVSSPTLPASLPVRVPAVEVLPLALSRRLLAEPTWPQLRLASPPPSGTSHPDSYVTCQAHKRRRRYRSAGAVHDAYFVTIGLRGKAAILQ